MCQNYYFLAKVLQFCYYAEVLCICVKSEKQAWKLCTKTLLPHTENYHERLSILMIPVLRISRKNLYRNHFLKVALDDHLQLHTLMPEKPSKHR